MPYVKKPLPAASKDYSPLPFYMEPSESPNRKIAKKYPLVMTNGRLPMYHHGTLRNNPISREIYPLPEIWVNPADAKKYGVAQGDWTWVENDRGKIRAKCRVTEGIPEGIVYQERFWNPETLNTPTKRLEGNECKRVDQKHTSFQRCSRYLYLERIPGEDF